MEIVTILFIAVALAMDAFAVSIVSGLTIKCLRFHHVMRIALFFGIFQGIMPLLGWALGRSFSDRLEDVDHWVAFFLLAFIGVKMIYESRTMEQDVCRDPCETATLFSLAVATSIDAFGVGLSLSILDSTILVPAVIIAVVTFVISFIGVYIGDIFGHMFEKKIEVLGGIILILIGLNILNSHLGIIG
jgi:putative Mn2+ efflux pump MntP